MIPRWLLVLPSQMGVLSQAVTVAVGCTPGVPVHRVPDAVRASGGKGLVGESCVEGLCEAQVMCGCASAQSAGCGPGFWGRGTRRGVVWRRSERLSRCGPRRRRTVIANETASRPMDLFALKPTTVAPSYLVASYCRKRWWRRWMPFFDSKICLAPAR